VKQVPHKSQYFIALDDFTSFFHKIIIDYLKAEVAQSKAVSPARHPEL
jgi:hypothetical protein